MTVRRGRKPKPVALRLVEGTRHRNDTAAPVCMAPICKPARLKGAAAKAWATYIEPAAWLDVTREPAAIAFCYLWAEFVAKPALFPAAKHSQLRAYMGELGLTDERNRPARRDDSAVDEFFDD